MPTLQPPGIAYIMLWFPLASETFIFREMEQLRQLGMNIRAYTMYGKSLKGCSREMLDYTGPITRMGALSSPAIFKAFMRYAIRRPRRVWNLMSAGLFKKMRNLESQAENLWCFMAGFLLAEQCSRDKIKLIHSAWANGPATAAWVASKLTGIPFAFTGRAGDIYPQDGILAEKAKDAVFIRTNNAANVNWLRQFCENGKPSIKLVYNGLTFAEQTRNQAPAKKNEDGACHILAVGRFARTKGFTYLLTAMARLKREGFPCRLTLVGAGSWGKKLLALRQRLGLEDVVEMPGFLPNDKLSELMRANDLLVVPSVVHFNGDRDGIPNVIMEACTMELPVVATDVCGISEVIRNGETGYLVPQRDAAALANAMRQCFEDREKSRMMAQSARELVKDMFDSQKNSRQLKDLYLSVIK